jgi:SAM-dependent methyltransferase
MKNGRCRFCGADLTETFANLGISPLANSYVSPARAGEMEPFYPLHVYVCSSCWLVQLMEFESPEQIFSEYLYFSSCSETWLRHAEAYSEKMIERFELNAKSQVVEIASNDGYLLQYFDRRGIAVLGVEPAANVAKVAIEKGVPTEVAFFGEATGKRLRDGGNAADLIAANNVLAHVPDINDFVRGFKKLLKPHGVVTVEFPHILRLMTENQFDTIYHEHFSYLSFLVAERIFAQQGLITFDVEELPTHGGSLRLYARHVEDLTKPTTPAVALLRQRELDAGLDGLEAYSRFAPQILATKLAVLDFFVRATRSGKRIAAYGAAAKGNTLLNYCGIRSDMIDFVVDRNPHKQGMLLPGTRIPIRHPDAIFDAKPDYVFILPWNIADEIVEQMATVRTWGAQFVVPIPSLRIF